ncbi:MAG TPA: hypothetical protein VGE07_13090, partial [Herpetosiphonaceae bacterium]
MAEIVRTQCPYCGVGCGLALTVEGGEIVRVAGDAAHPANGGKLCVKGATVDQTINPPGRLLRALL